MAIASDTLGQPLPFRENRFRRIFLLVFVLGITVVFLWLINSFLLTILLAAIFAGVLHPLFRRLVVAFKGRQPLAAFVTLLIGLLAVAAPVGGVVYMVTAEAIRLSANVRPWISQVARQPTSLAPLLERLPFAEHIAPYREQLFEKAGEWASSAGGFIVASLSTTTLGTVQAVFNFFILAYTVFFLLLDGPALLHTVRRFLPLREGERDLLLDKFVSVTRATLKGTLVIGIIQGTMAGLAFWVLRIDHAIFWGAIMTVLSVIPMLGGAVVWVPTAIVLALTGHWVKAVILAAFCGLIVGSVDNVLRPRLVGRDTQMHDLMILFSTLGGIIAFGALGFIIGPIIAALFQTAWELFGNAYRDLLPPAQKVVIEPLVTEGAPAVTLTDAPPPSDAPIP
ncbi:MAG TPA: AI-2E family transporter [Luteitalea sp.]|nr:AI-2E family transporter [Luteitalea sp.]